MGAILVFAVVLFVGAVWAFSPDKLPDGSDVTGVYAFPADSPHAPHARHTALDTQTVTGARP